jgi:hypothetical protein
VGRQVVTISELLDHRDDPALRQARRNPWQLHYAVAVFICS